MIKRGTKESWQAGREIGMICWRLGQALGCMTCGIGVAIDEVGRRYGEEPYNWRDLDASGGHDCENIRNGLTAEKQAEVDRLARHLGNSQQKLLPGVADRDLGDGDEEDFESEKIH